MPRLPFQAVSGAITGSDVLISAATVASVLMGVLVQAEIQRRRARRDKADELVAELGMLLPHVNAEISEIWQGERSTGLGSTWAERQERVTAILGALRPLSYGAFGRRLPWGQELDDLAARIVAAEMRWFSRRIPIAADELYNINPAELSRKMRGGRRSGPHLDDRIKWYETYGFKDKPPDGQIT